jgi:hypothetical protein
MNMHFAPCFPKKRRLGPQNDLGSLGPEKTAKISKLLKLPEKCFEPIEKGGWYQSRLLLIGFFQCMSPTRSEYSKLGLDLVSLEDNRSRMPKKPSMEEEKKNDGADDPINLLLEQALTR